MLPKIVRKRGTCTRLPQLAGYWACSSLIFLDPSPKRSVLQGAIWTAGDMPSRRDSWRALCWQVHAEQVQRDGLLHQFGESASRGGSCGRKASSFIRPCPATLSGWLTGRKAGPNSAPPAKQCWDGLLRSASWSHSSRIGKMRYLGVTPPWPFMLGQWP